MIWRFPLSCARECRATRAKGPLSGAQRSPQTLERVACVPEWARQWSSQMRQVWLCRWSTTMTKNGPMTTSESTTVTIQERLDFSSAAPQFSSAMNRLDSAATHELDRVGFPAGLRELVRLRASQLNGCAYCVDLHTTAAVAAGENVQRICSRRGVERVDVLQRA
jgi:AhpD family alkylhydroperoxidase